jgi:hypothetical protein
VEKRTKYRYCTGQPSQSAACESRLRTSDWLVGFHNAILVITGVVNAAGGAVPLVGEKYMMKLRSMVNENAVGEMSAFARKQMEKRNGLERRKRAWQRRATNDDCWNLFNHIQ